MEVEGGGRHFFPGMDDEARGRRHENFFKDIIMGIEEEAGFFPH